MLGLRTSPSAAYCQSMQSASTVCGQKVVRGLSMSFESGCLSFSPIFFPFNRYFPPTPSVRHSCHNSFFNPQYQIASSHTLHISPLLQMHSLPPQSRSLCRRGTDGLGALLSQWCYISVESGGSSLGKNERVRSPRPCSSGMSPL